MAPLFRSIRDAVIFAAKCGCWVLLTVFVLSSLRAASNEKEREKTVLPTFLRHPLIADVSRGGEVVIPVDVIALPGQKIALDVLTMPLFGSITPVWSDHSNKPSLVYRSDKLKKVATDEFSIRVRAEGRSWSTQKAIIRVHDHEAFLRASPDHLDFGDLPYGTTRSLVLVLSNSSGDDAVGTLSPSLPWRVDGDPSFTIPEGVRREFRITFAPEKPGDFLGTLEFSPGSGSWERIPLRGQSLPPFVINEDRLAATQENPRASVVLRNPASNSVKVSITSDPEVSVPLCLEVPPEGSSTLTMDVSRVPVPMESSRILHVNLLSGEYGKSVEITVSGRGGTIQAEIPSGTKNLQTTLSVPVRLSARLVNESRSDKEVRWNLQGEGSVVDGMERGASRLQGGESREISFLWLPAKPGPGSPKLVLSSGSSVCWNLECRIPQTIQENPLMKNAKSAGPHDKSGSEAIESMRLASETERQRMVILHPPVVTGAFYPRTLQLAWSYQGTGNEGFVIEERNRGSGMTDRTGESDAGWSIVHRTPVEVGRAGEWIVRIPVYLPGVREFRIYPAGEGERVLAGQTIPMENGIVFGPMLRILAIIAMILLSVVFLRMLANRRS